MQTHLISKIGAMCGIAAPLVGFSFILAAILQSPWFSWIDNALSDLGRSGFGAALFNTGLMLSGALEMLFAVGLILLFRDRLIGLVGSLVCLSGAVSLVLIGVFPETAGSIHMQVSVAFFLLTPLSLLTVGFELLRRPVDRAWGYGAIVAASVAGVVWLFPHKGVAIPEAVAAVVVSGWLAAFCIRILRRHDWREAREEIRIHWET